MQVDFNNDNETHFEREIDRLEELSRRQMFYLASCDNVWLASYRRVKAENDLVNVQLRQAWTAYEEHQARAAAAAAATAAALEREAGAQRALARLELLARHKENGLAYLATARGEASPAKRLEAARLALFSFEQWKATAVTRALREETAEAQRLAAAAQEELDKPFYAKWFEYASELLVTG